MKPPETKWDSYSTLQDFAALVMKKGILNPELEKQWESLPPGSCHGTSYGGSFHPEEDRYEYRNGKLYQKIKARS